MKNLLPYIYILAGFIGFLLILFFIVDSWILPSVVHSKEIVKVPKVTGTLISDAEKIAEDNKLQVHVNTENYSADLPKGTVINQSPKPYTEVKAGRSIYVSVSKGQETVPAPYMIGKTMRDARVLLMEKGLQLGDINYEFNDSIPRDTIFGQSIPAGRQIPYGSTLSVTVSKGPEGQIMVPSLVNLDYNEVLAALKESKLKIGTVTYKHSETYYPNTVIDQIPKANELVNSGTNVDIVISK